MVSHVLCGEDCYCIINLQTMSTCLTSRGVTIGTGTIVDCYFTLSILSPIVETAIDFSDSCLCGLKLISFRPKNKCLHHGIVKQTKTIDVLNISDLCFVNYEYMFKNCSLKLEKQHFHNVSVYNRY